MKLLGSDHLAVILVNDSGNNEANRKDADKYLTRYGMSDFARVRMDKPEAERLLITQLGLFGWGSVVIGSDGNLVGINLHSHSLGKALERATNTEPDEEDEFPITTAVSGPKGYGMAELTKKARTAEVRIKLQLPEGYHVYGADDGSGNFQPTTVTVNYAGGLSIGTPVLPEGTLSAEGMKVIEGSAMIKLPVEVPKGLPVGEYLIYGHVSFMACNEDSCLPPMKRQWKARVSIH